MMRLSPYNLSRLSLIFLSLFTPATFASAASPSCPSNNEKYVLEIFDQNNTARIEALVRVLASRQARGQSVDPNQPDFIKDLYTALGQPWWGNRSTPSIPSAYWNHKIEQLANIGRIRQILPNSLEFRTFTNSSGQIGHIVMSPRTKNGKAVTYGIHPRFFPTVNLINAAMHDPERWKVFFKDLAAKAEQIAKPQGREIAFEDVRKALEKEVEAIPGGNTIYTVKEFQPDRSQFLNTIRQGPFFIDEGVDHGHGKYSHLMQMLFVYRQIPEGNGHVSFSEFYHHLVTSNPDLWEDMFDASVPPSVTDGSVLLSPRSPEFISSLSDHGDGLPLQPRPFRAPSGN